MRIPQLLSAEVQAGIAAGNINLSSGPAGERLGLSENAQAAVDKQDDLLAQFERKKQVSCGIVRPTPALPPPCPVTAPSSPAPAR